MEGISDMNTRTDQTAVGLRLDEPDRSPVRITSPGELVASIPAIFGFQPAQSLVGLLLTARSALACSARIDLAEGLPGAAEVLAHACRSADADRAVLLVYTDAVTGPMPYADDVTELVDELGQQGIHVVQVLLVDEPRFWLYGQCGFTKYWLSQGSVIPTESTELERCRASAGVAPVCGSREALEDRYRRLPELAPTRPVFERERVVLDLPVSQRCIQAVDDLRELLQRGSGAPGVGDGVDDVRARLMLLLQDVVVRDHLLAGIAEADDVIAAADALSWLALTSPPELRPALAAGAATLQYLRGDNPVATTALLDLAQDQKLARLLRTWIGLAIPPHDLREVLLGSTSREADATAS